MDFDFYSADFHGGLGRGEGWYWVYAGNDSKPRIWVSPFGLRFDADYKGPGLTAKGRA
jgi:hypothetical protein